MKNVLIVYGSWAGSTAEVAERIGAALGKAGCATTTMPAEDREVDLSSYDLVVIGSAIHGARPHEKVKQFTDANWSALLEKKLVAFAVCMTITSSKADRRRAALAFPELVAGGRPPLSGAVFGGRAPSSGWLGNLMGKLMLGITPGDYRDWQKIDAWAASLSALVR